MGFSITWCAVREEHADQFVQKLHLILTGETEEVPESLDSMATLECPSSGRAVRENRNDEHDSLGLSSAITAVTDCESSAPGTGESKA